MLYLKATVALISFIVLFNLVAFIFDLLFSIPVLNWFVMVALLISAGITMFWVIKQVIRQIWGY